MTTDNRIEGNDLIDKLKALERRIASLELVLLKHLDGTLVGGPAHEKFDRQ
jgi:hypothetical protein